MRNIKMLIAEYGAARISFRITERTVARLAREGNHKKKNKIINTQLAKEALAVNKARSDLLAAIDAEVEESLKTRFPESWTG